MSSKSPIFPMPESHHFSDYGFDPQLGYFQVLEEARKHKKESSLRSSAGDALHFKLQKPISKDETSRSKSTKKWWWKNPLLFFKKRRWTETIRRRRHASGYLDGDLNVHRRRATAFGAVGSISGPVYATESMSGSSTPYRTRPASGQLAGIVQVPYMSLTEFNMDQQQRISTSSAMPIYLVT